MITQRLKQGNNKIIIESAESLEDAKKNGFPEGIYTRFFINEKQIESYIEFVYLIMEETRKNKNPFLLQNKDELVENRKKLILQDREDMKNQINEIKKRYENINFEYAEKMLKSMDEMIKKVDEYGARVLK